MKSYSRALLRPTVVTAAFALLASSPAFGGDKAKNDVMVHVSLHTKMHNEGVIAQAAGDADIHFDEHGGKDAHQELHLHVKNLDAGADYTLTAQDNVSNVVQLASFTTDDHGNADLHFREKGPKNPHDHAGHVDGQLPAELQPATSISGLLIADTNGASILTADFTAPHDFHYEAKLDLSSGSIRAKLEINADAHHAKLNLDAHGLDAGASYSLAVNGNVVGSASADEHGHLHLHSQLQNSADVLSPSSVELLDANSNVVLSATVQ